MDACNSEKLSDLNIEPPGERHCKKYSQNNKNFQLDIKAVQMACLSCPLKEDAVFGPKQIPPRDRDIQLVDKLLRHKPAADKAHSQHQPLVQRLRG
jgi:hypothetical protein